MFFFVTNNKLIGVSRTKAICATRHQTGQAVKNIGTFALNSGIMSTTTFTFKKPKDTLFYFLGGLFFSYMALNFAFKIIAYSGFSINSLISLILPLAVVAPGVLLFNVCLLRSQYQKIDGGKTLMLDNETGQLTVSCNNKSSTLNNEDIKNVERYESWSISSRFHMPAYLKISLKNGQHLIITSFLATEEEIGDFIRDAEILIDVNLLFKVPASDMTSCIF